MRQEFTNFIIKLFLVLHSCLAMACVIFSKIVIYTEIVPINIKLAWTLKGGVTWRRTASIKQVYTAEAQSERENSDQGLTDRDLQMQNGNKCQEAGSHNRSPLMMLQDNVSKRKGIRIGHLFKKKIIDCNVKASQTNTESCPKSGIFRPNRV